MLEKSNIFETYSLRFKKIQRAGTKIIEEWLKPFQHEITYLGRGRKFGTFKVRFRTEEHAK